MLGLIHADRGQHQEAERLLCGAATYFDHAVCLSDATYKMMKDEVEVKDAAGRLVKPKNTEEVRVWDVIGWRAVQHG